MTNSPQRWKNVKKVNAGAPITVFEITTAVGLLLFARHPADVLLLEVGLGGRLDATNVIERPLATVITPISIDHTDFRRHDREDRGRKSRHSQTRRAGHHRRAAARALAVIERQAARLGAPMKIAGEDWTATEERGRLVYQDEAGLLDLPAPKLYGRHQFENAGWRSPRCAAIPDLKISPAAYRGRGIVSADWPARLQRLGPGPAGRAGAARQRAVAGRRAQSRRRPRHRRRARRSRGARLASAGADRRHARHQADRVGFLCFNGLARRLIGWFRCPCREGPHAAPGSEAGAARAIGLPATSRDNLDEALDAARKLDLDPPPRILITGSLYLAGEVLKANGTPPA